MNKETRAVERGSAIKNARKSRGWTQAELADRIGVDRVSISNWENAAIDDINPKHIVKLSATLGLDMKFLATDSRLADLAHSIAEQPVNYFSNGEFVEIEKLNIIAECGDGILNEWEHISTKLAFRKDWLDRMGFDPSELRIITAGGVSMQPTINPMDQLIVNIKQIDPRMTGVYVLEEFGMARVKRLQMRSSDTITITSDNNINQPEQVNISEFNVKERRITGRVVYVMSGKSI